MISRIGHNSPQRQNFGISEGFLSKKSSVIVGQSSKITPASAQSSQVKTAADALIQAKSADDLLCLLTLGTHK